MLPGETKSLPTLDSFFREIDMSHADASSRTESAYRSPAATVVGRVEELTAGHAYNYPDGTGNYQQDRKRVEESLDDEE